MAWYEKSEGTEGESPHTTDRGFVRRGRRYTPPQPLNSYNRAARLASLREARKQVREGPISSVRLGDVLAELTPRQAVVWLLNLETMLSLYESTTEHPLDDQAKNKLVNALRRIIRDHRNI